MNTLRHFTSRLPLTALLLPLTLLFSACSAYKNNGSLSIFGVLYVILAIAAIISLLKQDWSLTKKTDLGSSNLVLPLWGLYYLLPFLWSEIVV